jgi:hypothetical protein
MPRLNFSQVLVANTPVDVLANWQYQYIPRSGTLNVCLRSTTGTGKYTLSAGSDSLAEQQPTPAGGTAGQTPTPFNSPVLSENVAGGDRLKLLLVDTGAATVDGFVDYQPFLG